MIDPLSEVVTLLQPRTSISKVVIGAGAWGVRRSVEGQPFYCVVLCGSCRLTVDGHEPITLQKDDFILMPAAYEFTVSSLEPATAADFLVTAPVEGLNGEFRVGVQSGPSDVRLLIGYCVFGSPDAALLVSLLPQLVHVCGEGRLATLVQLVGDESRQLRPARDVVLAHLLEVLLIEAFRSTTNTTASPGLLRGLSDERIALAIRQMHGSPTRSWTIMQLAKEASLSRSAFFERFIRAVGVAPMEYLLRWRMALAKKLLVCENGGVAKIAEQVGYGSASAFSVAFTRHVGLTPMRYAREQIVLQRM